jgi:hypothetical protein
MQDLDRDIALVAEVVREIDRGRAPRAEFRLDAVAVRDGVGQAGERCGRR